MNPGDAHVLAALRNIGGGVAPRELAYQMRRHRRPAHPDVSGALIRLETEGLVYRPYEGLDSYFATERAIA